MLQPTNKNTSTVKKWINSYNFHSPKLKKKVFKLTNSLANTYFYKNSEYAVEKLVKTFVENLLFLENTLLRQRGVHPEQINPDDYNPIRGAEKVQHLIDIEKILLNEAHRLFRHYIIIFTSIRPTILKKCN